MFGNAIHRGDEDCDMNFKSFWKKYLEFSWINRRDKLPDIPAMALFAKHCQQKDQKTFDKLKMKADELEVVVRHLGIQYKDSMFLYCYSTIQH